MSVRKGNQIIAGTPRTTGGVEIGDMGFAPLGIDESLNLRRYLNGQVISQTQFVSFTTKIKSAVALFPNLGTTESNWQAEKALSKFGQVGKFVIDDTAQTIRLPAVVNAQGLLGLSGIGNLVNESLPNITGANLVQASNTDGCFYGIQNANITMAAGTGTGYGTGFDASRSSSAYQNGAPVQQEAVQYPYYIQVATGIEETLPAVREYQVNNSDYFGKSMYSDIAPDNASWLASNGSYNSRSVYPDYYDWLNSKIGQVITANGGKVVLSTDTITDYDFVVNQNDQTFRLPLLNGEEDLPSDRYDSLTYVSGKTYIAPANGWFATGGPASSFYSISFDTIGTLMIPTGTVGYARGVGFVKRGGTFFIDPDGGPTPDGIRFTYAKGNGTLYYYVGDTVQDASLINAGAVLGQLSNKADIDASNFNADGKSLLSGLGMPSNRYIDLTLGASGTQYTAPASGWFRLVKKATSVGQSITFNPVEFYRGQGESDAWVYQFSSMASQTLTITLPVLKGQKTWCYYSASGDTVVFEFIYAEGDQ